MAPKVPSPKWPRKPQVMQKGSENAQSKWPRKRQVRQKAPKVPSHNGFESAKQEWLRKCRVQNGPESPKSCRRAPKMPSQNGPESAKSGKRLRKCQVIMASKAPSKKGSESVQSEWLRKCEVRVAPKVPSQNSSRKRQIRMVPNIQKEEFNTEV